ncbi:hypothetical protein CYMTET_30396 [Cymbomonas tetramitiformis]|uniref:Uncharacterized protein n=1 Tax=Cymbomonas tetramitiformis TaxID=36881 RepID=A0AAE0KTY6_9CHLO|nr:hypothetical protein CYMTET_30396 [Cymbomonas tetramitiformis]
MAELERQLQTERADAARHAEAHAAAEGEVREAQGKLAEVSQSLMSAEEQAAGAWQLERERDVATHSARDLQIALAAAEAEQQHPRDTGMEEARLLDAQMRAADAETQLRTAQAELSEMEGELHKLGAEKTASETARVAAEEEVECVRRQLGQTESEEEDRVRQLQEERDKASRNATETRKQAQQAELERKEAVQRCAEMEAEVRQLQETRDEEKASAGASVECLESAREAPTKGELEAESAAREAKAESAELREQMETARAQEAELREQMVTARAQEAELREQMVTARAQEAELREQMETARAQEAELREQMVTARAQEAELREQMVTARAQEAELRQELQVAHDRAALAEAQAQALEAAVTEDTADGSGDEGAANNSGDVMPDLRDAQAELDKAQEATQSAAAAVQAMRAECKPLEAEAGKIKGRVSEAETKKPTEARERMRWEMELRLDKKRMEVNAKRLQPLQEKLVAAEAALTKARTEEGQASAKLQALQAAPAPPGDRKGGSKGAGVQAQLKAALARETDLTARLADARRAFTSGWGQEVGMEASNPLQAEQTVPELRQRMAVVEKDLEEKTRDSKAHETRAAEAVKWAEAMEEENSEMKARFSDMSVRYASSEAEREELKMRLRQSGGASAGAGRSQDVEILPPSAISSPQAVPLLL